MLEKKCRKQKRRLNTETELTRSDEKKVKRLLGER
jgi:ribosomal protein L35